MQCENFKRAESPQITLLYHFRVGNKVLEQNVSKVYVWLVKRPIGRQDAFLNIHHLSWGSAALPSSSWELKPFSGRFAAGQMLTAGRKQGTYQRAFNQEGSSQEKHIYEWGLRSPTPAPQTPVGPAVPCSTPDVNPGRLPVGLSGLILPSSFLTLANSKVTRD